VTEGDAGAVTKTATASHEGVLDEASVGPAPGSQVGRYRVDRPLGTGGMGVVVEAHDPELDRQVALKLVRADIGDREYRARLVREARAMAQLEHPNVVRVYDAGQAGGEVFVAMELVRGDSLGRWMREAPRPWREVVARFAAAGRGLAAAHAAGMVHRDFKPDNVLVRESDGRVCVTDFGLAVPIGGGGAPPAPGVAVAGDDPTVAATPSARPPATSAGAAKLTNTGVAVGTPPYMAPEQHVGADVDRRADVFSFCVALYEGVYGERPFTIDRAARDPAVAWAEAICGGRVRPAPPGRRVPAALRRALLRGLTVDRDVRWPSMEPLLAALERVRGRRARLAVAGTAIGAAGLLAASLAYAARSPAAPVEDPCAVDAARIDSIWNAETRTRSERALTAGGQAYAAVTARESITIIDRWAVAWRDERQNACREEARGVLARPAYQTRIACLDDALATMRARIGLLQGGAVLHAVGYASVPDPSTCAGGDQDPRPTDPALAKRIAAVEEKLRTVSAARIADDYAHGAPRARTALAEARAIGWRPLIDHAAYELVELDDAADESLDEAAPLAREVAESVSARGDWDQAAKMWRLAIEIAHQSGRLEALDYLVSAARGAAKHMRDPDDRLVVEAAIGEAYVAAGRIDEARATCEAALGEAERITTAGAEAEGRALGCLTLVADREGRYDAVVPLTERHLAFDLRVRGPRHPWVINDLANLSVAFSHLGRLRDAMVARVAVHVMVLDAEGPDSADTADSWMSMAETYANLGDAAHARAAAARGVAIVEHHARAPDDPLLVSVLQVQGYVLDEIGDPAGGAAVLEKLFDVLVARRPGSQDEVVAALNAGAALQKVGRCAEAMRMLDRATTDARDVPPIMALYLESQRASCRLHLGRAAEALRDLEPAWKRVDRSQIPPAERAPVEATLAQLLQKNGDRARALEVALRARDDVSPEESAAQRAEIDQLIAELHGPAPR
jgi:tetratricopeptide (TPR) repeat protein